MPSFQLLPRLNVPRRVSRQESSAELLGVSPSQTEPEPKSSTPQDQDQEQQQQQPPSTLTTFLQDSWFPEGLALGFSLACFISIFVILQVFSNQASPSLPQGLTLNSMLSVLATASKSALIFTVGESIGQMKWVWFQTDKRKLLGIQSIDDATRGPLGAITVLLEHRCRSLVSLGALVTLLALAFEPFMQQIVTYPVRQTPSSLQNATIQRSSFFVPRVGWWGSRIASNAGIWTQSEVPLLETKCTSGNCTWPQFDSVGLCSQCEEVTAQASITSCDDLSVPFSMNMSQTHTFYCNISLPHGTISRPVQLIPKPEGYDYRMGILAPRSSLWLMNDLAALPEYNKTYAGVRSPVLAFGYFQTYYDISGEEFDPSHPGKGLTIAYATECILSPCARTFDVSIFNGASSVNVTAVDYGEVYKGKVYPGGYDDVCWRRRPGATAHNTVIDEYESYYADASVPSFCSVYGPTMAIQNDLVGNSNWTWYYEKAPDSSWQLGQDNFYGYPETQDWIISAGPEKVLRNYAAAMTKYNAESSDDWVQGAANVSEVYVSVDWTFLILPVLLLLLGMIFFIATVLVTKKHRLSLWKSSILPVLYHGLDDELVKDGHTSRSKMERTAQSLQVQFGYSDVRRRFLLQNDPSDLNTPTSAHPLYSHGSRRSPEWRTSAEFPSAPSWEAASTEPSGAPSLPRKSPNPPSVSPHR